MTFPDLIKNLLDSSKERLKTPIVGSYMIAFLFYNWRVLAVLLVSKATVEDRIIVINHEYLGFFAYFWPFIIALVYSIGVPYLMMWIDERLVFVKSARRKQIYDGKSSLLDLKIELADKELELQDKLSRNRDKQEMLDQIKSLEDDKELLTKNNKDFMNEVRNLREEIEDLRDGRYFMQESTGEDANFIGRKDVLKLIDEKLPGDVKQILSTFEITTGEPIFHESFSQDELNELVDNKILKYGFGKFFLTELGIQFILYLIDDKGYNRSRKF